MKIKVIFLSLDVKHIKNWHIANSNSKIKLEIVLIKVQQNFLCIKL